MNSITIITNSKSKKNMLKELWENKEVLYFLSWKDIIVRYKQTVLGILWAVIQPIISMVVMTVIFGNIAKLDSGGVPYPVMVFTALIPWNFFSTGINSISNSFVINNHLIKKIYFPRLALPISSLITTFIDSLISIVILGILMVGFMYIPPIRILLIPVFYILAFLILLGGGILLATINVKYRDIRYLVPFMLQFGMYVSPVGYSSSVIPEQYKLLYSLNPLVGIIDGFRWCIIESAPLNLPAVIVSAIYGVVLLVAGIRFFNKFENSFADII